MIDSSFGIERFLLNYIQKYDYSFFKRIIFQVHSVSSLIELYNKYSHINFHYNTTLESAYKLINIFKEYNIHTISIEDTENLDIELIKKLNRLGLHVFVYTVNYLRRVNYLKSIGISGIITDKIYPKNNT